MRLFEWESAPFEEHGTTVHEFVNYLASVWQNRNRYIESTDYFSPEEVQAQKIHKQRFFDFSFDGKISARNYVGVVQYNNIRIQVYPKIFSEDEQVDTTKWQLNLLYWLSYCRKIKFPFSFANVSEIEFDDYLELLIYIFGNFTAEIISQQPFQAYQVVEEETPFLKGRLLFESYIKQNIATGKWQNFFCAHSPFVYDNLFNRIIKYVTKRLVPICENGLTLLKLNEILYLLDDVSDVRCTAEDCEKVKLNPLFDDHKQVLELCKMFLSNQVIDMDSDDNRNFCFLVPMEYVFEDFVFGFISDKWRDLNMTSQSKEYLAIHRGSPVFQIRNDIYIENQLIIDTKYKIRYAEEGLKVGVSQNDLYQMVGYAIRRNCKDVLLLYPKTQASLNDSALFLIPSTMFPEEINIHVENLDISFDKISEAETIIKDRITLLNPIFKR